MILRAIFLMFIYGVFANFALAQNMNDNSGNVLAFNIHYAFQQPQNDLAARFGRSSTLGIGVDFLNDRNFIFGLTGDYQFGTEVKEDVLANLRDANGNIIGRDQGIASLVLRQRGIAVGTHIGKLFPLSNKSRSGIRFTLGAGVYQHKIRIQDDLDSVPQVAGEYKKGYDRLTNGLAITQFLGYQIMSPSRRINMYIGIEALQAFTQNRRSYNYDTMSVDTEKRIDSLFSLKIAWTILPVFMSENDSEIYY